MKREDEEHAKASFDWYLRNKYPNTTIRWEDVEQQNEPPDYFIYLGTEKIAVEVTTLMESVELGGPKALTFQGVIHWMDEFVKETEKIASSQDYLNGEYVIKFNRPIKDFGQLKQQIQLDILNYIHETKSFESAPEKIIYQAPRLQKCTITKVNRNKNRVYRSGPTNGKRGIESNKQLIELINKSIHEKESKLRKIISPKILLLLDKYLFSEFDEIAEIEVAEDFYAVVAIRGGTVSVIHLKEKLKEILNEM